MRTLYLLRHAQAESTSAAGDRARCLTDRGRADARAVGQLFAGHTPELVLCSTATRTLQTLNELGLPPAVTVENLDALYLCDPQTMLQRVRETPTEVASVLVIGHNPTIPALAAEVLWTHDRRAAGEIADHCPTATLIELSLSQPWSALDHAQLVAVTRVRRGESRPSPTDHRYTR